MNWIYRLLFVLICISACKSSRVAVQNRHTPYPNILWITVEDISPTLSMYGDSTAQTPNLNALAADATIYDNVFATVGVCAPARSSVITGMYPTSIGTMHMRTGKDITAWGKRKYKNNIETVDLDHNSIREYSAVLPQNVKCFTEHLRSEGYYCTNNAKTDYQFAAPLAGWDENGNYAHWKNAPDGNPFFSVFNINLTHESKLWKHQDKPLTVDPRSVIVPPYLPDVDAMRTTVARNYSNIELMDKKVGQILQQLKEDGLYDNTIIFFYSDHGGPLPRQKREAYDSGLKVPMMVKAIGQQQSARDDQLISFVDLAPTVLEMAGLEIPNYIQGQSFINDDKRKYVHGSGDRFDEITDRVRIIRTDKFLYVKNYYSNLAGYKDLKYRKNIPGMNEFLELKDEGSINEIQSLWFSKKGDEELYEVEKDPHNLYNLAGEPRLVKVLAEHRALLDNHIDLYGDLGALSESTLIESMWPDGSQPETEVPMISVDNNQIYARSSTSGAVTSFLISDQPVTKLNRDDKWQLLTSPIPLVEGKHIAFVAERIGFSVSELVNYPAR